MGRRSDFRAKALREGGMMGRTDKKKRRALTGLEVLGVAIRSEMEAQRFYAQALRRVQNPILRDKLSRLAAEEKRHRQILEERYRRSSGEENPPIPRKGGPEGKEKMSSQGLSPEEILRTAIRMEQQAAKFYQQEALRTADMSGRFMLEYLADFERNHERSLQTEWKALNRFPDWFSLKDPTVMLVGP
jgi:rubrerythrin